MQFVDEQLKPIRVLVVGDLMVDEYMEGTVTRISPEAPVPILKLQNRVLVPGGAANVALNLRLLGNDVEVVGVVGPDEYGSWLINNLSKLGVDTSGLVTDETRPTTVKTRFTTPQQSILRVDVEENQPVQYGVSAHLARNVSTSISSRNTGVVLVSDYMKGGLGERNHPLVELLATLASEGGIVIGADTKRVGKELSMFKQYTFVKPNQSELEQAVGLVTSTLDEIQVGCMMYQELAGCKNVLVTLGANGMYHYGSECAGHVPTVSAHVYDVTGAGDTAFATIGYALGNGHSWKEAMKIANIAASIAVSHRGTKSVTLEELKSHLAIRKTSNPSYSLHA